MANNDDTQALQCLVALIREFEGCRLTPYLCPAGVLTCGWGATGAGVNLGEPWTQDQADNRLHIDSIAFLRGTKLLCPSLYGYKLGAIADFSYNLGLGRLRASTLRKLLNAGTTDERIAIELQKWNKGGGKVLAGLVRRREAEILVFSN